MSLVERFREVAAQLQPVRFRPPEPSESSPLQVFRNAIRPWAEDAACEQTFLPWLDAEIRAREAKETESLDSHARQSYWKGRADELKSLRDAFHQWRQPPARPRPGAEE